MRGGIDATLVAQPVRPRPRQQLVEARLDLRLRDVTGMGFLAGLDRLGIEDPVIDDIAVQPSSPSDELPLDAAALTVDAERQDQGARRDDAALEAAFRSPVSQVFPRQGLSDTFEGPADIVVPEDLLGLSRFGSPCAACLDRQPAAGEIDPAFERRIGHPDIEGSVPALPLQL